MSAPLVGVDLGGTAIKAGACDAAGSVLEERELATELEGGADHVLDRMAAVARDLGAREVVGVGVPGLLDRERGLVTRCPNLRALEGVPLRAMLAERLGIPEDAVRLENDANVAALGEHWVGGARAERDVAVVTLGTGVGGGLILDGALYTGPGGLAGELGHLCVDPAGPPCGCGGRGCVEALASATAAARRAREAGIPGELAEIADRARAADGPERALLRDVGRDLGHGLALAAVLLDLSAFLVGGGFGAALDVLRDGVLDGLLERSWGRDRGDFRVLPATLGHRAGWIGAARLADSPHG